MNISQEQKKNEIPALPKFSASSLSREKQKRKTSRNVSISNSGSPGLSKSLLKSAPSVDDDAVIAAPPASATTEQLLSNNLEDNNDAPTHIPVVEESTASSDNHHHNNSITDIHNSSTKYDEKRDMDNNKNNNDKSITPEENNMSDESEYEYEDDDDAAFSGFLMANNGYGTTNNSSNNSNSATSSTAPARIVDEDTGTVAAFRSSTGTTNLESLEDEEPEPPAVEPSRKKWREPSRAAVNMSLRAQQETSGSKRRLAQDLYRIMNQDTEEAGFSLAPQAEDSMEKWTIKLFQFDPDSNLAKDMMVLGIDCIELEMKFPEQYPFEPPFVRVAKPRFKRQTGFVMNGALCMELLTQDGWNPINDIESVIVSIRSLLVVGDGRLQAATEITKARYETLLSTAQQQKTKASDDECFEPELKKARIGENEPGKDVKIQVGSYTATEAQTAYSHLSDYHKKKGWDTSGWWARKG